MNRFCSIVRMLLGLKTAEERKLEADFELARKEVRGGTDALAAARRKVEKARADVHARAEALGESGEYSGIVEPPQQQPGEAR
jgi:hypothetical protein